MASVVLAEALDKPDAKKFELRAAALIALVLVIENPRAAEPSVETRALGLGW